VLRSLLRPRQTDFGALDIAAIKDALSGLERHVNHRPVSVEPEIPPLFKADAVAFEPEVSWCPEQRKSARLRG